MAKVSVIVPIYRVEKYIERCVRSLFEQSLDEIEYIFVDDCSPDQSIEILKRIMNEYSSRLLQENKIVKIIRMSVNSGQAAVRKRGIQAASGDYIIHCDSDDWINQNMYRFMYEKAIICEADMVVCDYYEYYHGKILQIQGMKSEDSFWLDMMYSKVSWALWNKMIKREIFNTNFIFPQYNTGEDMVIILESMLNIKKISYLPLALYYYCFNASSIMNSPNRQHIIAKYQQSCENVNLLNSIYQSCSPPFEYSLPINAIKLYCKTLLLPVWDSSLNEEWKVRFRSEVNSALLDTKVNLQNKLRILLHKIGLYKIVRNVKNHYRCLK